MKRIYLFFISITFLSNMLHASAQSHFEQFGVDPLKVGALLATLEDVRQSPSSKDQKILFERLLKIRDGQAVSGIKKNDASALFVLASELKKITTSQDDLDERAAYNCAFTFHNIAKNKSLCAQHYTAQGCYQEAYYYFTLLSKRAKNKETQEKAQKSAQTLLDTGKILPLPKIKTM